MTYAATRIGSTASCAAPTASHDDIHAWTRGPRAIRSNPHLRVVRPTSKLHRTGVLQPPGLHLALVDDSRTVRTIQLWEGVQIYRFRSSTSRTRCGRPANRGRCRRSSGPVPGGEVVAYVRRRAPTTGGVPAVPGQDDAATRRFGEAVLNKALTHSADPDLHPPFLIEVIPGLGLLRENQLWLSGA